MTNAEKLSQMIEDTANLCLKYKFCERMSAEDCAKQILSGLDVYVIQSGAKLSKITATDPDGFKREYYPVVPLAKIIKELG